MKIESLHYFLLFIVISLAQVMIFSNIHLFGFATPMLQVYFIMLIRRGYPRWGILLFGFLMGLLLDSFANTPGVGSASLTLVALLQPMVLEAFMQRESDPELKPSVAFLGFAKYLTYATILTLTFCVSFFTLENFNFFNWEQWGMSILGCFIFTMVVVIVLEMIRGTK